MFRILKALVLAWLGKKVFDAVTQGEEPAKTAPRPKGRATRGRAKHA